MDQASVPAAIEAASHLASAAAALVLLVLAVGLRLASASRSVSVDPKGDPS